METVFHADFIRPTDKPQRVQNEFIPGFSLLKSSS
jgi:hypothetical protein